VETSVKIYHIEKLIRSPYCTSLNLMCDRCEYRFNFGDKYIKANTTENKDLFLCQKCVNRYFGHVQSKRKTENTIEY
jgi:hypothetical protein